MNSNIELIYISNSDADFEAKKQKIEELIRTAKEVVVAYCGCYDGSFEATALIDRRVVITAMGESGSKLVELVKSIRGEEKLKADWIMIFY